MPLKDVTPAPPTPPTRPPEGSAAPNAASASLMEAPGVAATAPWAERGNDLLRRGCEVLKPGATGADVAVYKKLARDNGIPVSSGPENTFSAEDSALLATWQQQNGRQPDGKVGDQMWGFLLLGANLPPGRAIVGAEGTVSGRVPPGREAAFVAEVTAAGQALRESRPAPATTTTGFDAARPAGPALAPPQPTVQSDAPVVTARDLQRQQAAGSERPSAAYGNGGAERPTPAYSAMNASAPAPERSTSTRPGGMNGFGALGPIDPNVPATPAQLKVLRDSVQGSPTAQAAFDAIQQREIPVYLGQQSSTRWADKPDVILVGANEPDLQTAALNIVHEMTHARNDAARETAITQMDRPTYVRAEMTEEANAAVARIEARNELKLAGELNTRVMYEPEAVYDRAVSAELLELRRTNPNLTSQQAFQAAHQVGIAAVHSAYQDGRIASGQGASYPERAGQRWDQANRPANGS